MTTRVWDMATGDCIKTVKNPVKRPRPQTLLFVEKDNTILVGSEDRCVRSFSLDDDCAEYDTKAQIDEQSLEDTMVNFPICSALSPDGHMIAFGYRGHPVTFWELEPPMLLGQCNLTLDPTDMTVQENTWGEVFRLTWHPFSGEVLGLTQVGLLFKCDPYEEETSPTVQTGADYLTISRDGSLAATGDAVGTIKVYATADLSLLYQLSSQNPVFHLSFSTDSRRLYDIRGAYGNVWEPNALVRFADSSEYPDHNSDALSETESLTKLSLHTEHYFARVDDVIALSRQSVGPLYCYGTEDGVAVLCEVGRGKVCELERLTSYMSIEQVVWSEDGRLAAIADLSGRLSIKRIAKVGQDRDTWQVNHEFDLVIPPHHGHISQLESQYLVFTVANIHLDSGSDDTNTSSKELPYTLLPADIASRIREPLAFLSHRGLVFLDVDRWICTWRLPSSMPRRSQGGSGSESGSGGIEQYYFLPGDWVTANEVHLCTIMPDGTLLCPQNGEVATVQCAKLRK